MMYRDSRIAAYLGIPSSQYSSEQNLVVWAVQAIILPFCFIAITLVHVMYIDGNLSHKDS